MARPQLNPEEREQFDRLMASDYADYYSGLVYLTLVKVVDTKPEVLTDHLMAAAEEMQHGDS